MELLISYYGHIYEDSCRGRKMMRSHFSTEDVEVDGVFTNVITPLPREVIDDLNDDTPLSEYPCERKLPRVGNQYQAAS